MPVAALEPSVKQGLFQRVTSVFEVIDRLPDELSDEEVEGLTLLLPRDVANTLHALFIPRARPASISFAKMLGRWLSEARRAKEEGRKVILVPFNFIPELVHAFGGAFPLTSEILTTLGVALLEGQGERYWDYAMGLGIPDHICSSSTIELGSMLAGEDFKADAIISSGPGGCDANAKIHEFVAHYLGIPQFILEKPVDDSPRGTEQYRKYVYRLVEELEEFIGEELDEDRLREVVENCNRATELYLELWEMRKNIPCPVPNLFSFFSYGCRFTMWGRPEAVQCMQAMVDVSRERLEAGAYPAQKEIARCGWLYTGYYFDFMGLHNWMEEQGYSYLCDMLNLCFPQPISTESKESMLEGLALAAANMPMTRQMGGDSMSMTWLDDAIYTVKDLNANCAIFSGHHACKQSWSVVSIIRSELMKQAGVPVLCLQGDSWSRTITPVGVLQRELDQFVKNVVVKKKKRGRSRKGRAREEG